MKIVQAVGWYFPDSLGGTEVYVAGLCRRLRDAGQDVLVAAPDPAAAVERSYEHDGIPVYRYPIFNEPLAYTKRCPTYCPHYEGEVDFSEGLCPNAEYIVPRMFNTVLSPVEDERIHRYADALAKTVKHFS